jgi:hypothetical protein
MRWIIRNPRYSIPAGLVLLAGLAWVAFGFFGVHLLFVDDKVAEPAPSVGVAEYTGTFVSRDHPTSGTAIVLGDGSGQRFVRFESFETSNGPDLNVYLVNSAAGGVDDVIDLGNLKGNIGDQNYEIPADVDLGVYDTVLIWCVRFSSPFGEATITPA